MSFVAHWDEVRRERAPYKIDWRGVGVMARVEKLDYWDGEA
jgi:hypothetical protein